MLNRRFLRIKAVQAVFSYQVRKEANVFRTNDFIDTQFAPDLTSAARPDYEELSVQAKQAKEVFAKCYDNRELDENLPVKVKKAVEVALRYYDSRNNEDKKEVKEQLVQDTEEILNNYYHILSFFVQLADFIEKAHEARKNKNGALVNLLELNFVNNAFVQKLRAHEDFQYLIAKHDATWQTETQQEFLKSIYKDLIVKDEEYLTYQTVKDPTFEQDCEIVAHILKKIIFKKELVRDYYEDSDINWEDNKDVVKSLALKTIKKAIAEQEIMFFDLALNWKEDKDYFLDLFEAGIKDKPEIKAALDQRLDNWDSDRVTLTDKVIIHLALNEMIMYPSIPIKVTINEFIEAAKRYSTPKSKIFVNGILDKASKDLLKEGKIKKSGRGLLDNK